MVRVGLERHEEALAQAHARPMDLTGEAMAGDVLVAPEAYESDEVLAQRVRWGAAFVSTPSVKKEASVRERPAAKPRVTVGKPSTKKR